ncbi:MAG: sigma-70 family RNA polymerase sigma factor [Clostridium sp.]|nr:sigma-70 family RNA polymerase sigma factor [Clostridium sp.]
MTTINLRKYYYPMYKTDVFVEVTDEVAEAMKHFDRQMNNYQRRTVYHRAYYSLDAYDWTENYALEHGKSPEEILLEREEQAAHRQLIAALPEAFSLATPLQARRLHMRYMLGMKYREIAAAEGISPTQASQSVRGAVKRLQKYFKKRKWTKEEPVEHW